MELFYVVDRIDALAVAFFFTDLELLGESAELGACFFTQSELAGLVTQACLLEGLAQELLVLGFRELHVVAWGLNTV